MLSSSFAGDLVASLQEIIILYRKQDFHIMRVTSISRLIPFITSPSLQ
uniref:Uncharacterized protein n=1 Tax=Arundo donax TaxID=35708 RepID=A0A0A9FZU0_ARUDO